MTAAEQPGSVWKFEDLAWLAAAVLPSLLLGGIVVRAGAALAPTAFANRAVQALSFQAAFYLWMLAALYAIVSLRHRQPFWRSLAWAFPIPGAWRCLAAAPILVVAIAMLGELLRTPVVPTPWEDFLGGKASQAAVLLFVAVLGPVWEELMFRGFLYGLLERSLGPWWAIFASAIPFGLVHGAQNEWLWQYMFLVGLSGVAFGFARHQTGSTAAAALMHSAYNTVQFVVFLIQRL